MEGKLSKRFSSLTSNKKVSKSKVQFAETEEGKREEAKNMRNLNTVLVCRHALLGRLSNEADGATTKEEAGQAQEGASGGPRVEVPLRAVRIEEERAGGRNAAITTTASEAASPRSASGRQGKLI